MIEAVFLALKDGYNTSTAAHRNHYLRAFGTTLVTGLS